MFDTPGLELGHHLAAPVCEDNTLHGRWGMAGDERVCGGKGMSTAFTYMPFFFL